MARWLLTALAGLTLTAAASAHFVYVVPRGDGSKVQVVFSDSLAPDENVDIGKIAALKLQVRDANGTVAPVACEKGEHCLNATVAGSGPRVVFGSIDYGVTERGGAKPFLLRYHPKTLLGAPANATLGESAVIEIVPAIDGGKVRFQVLAKGKPVAKTEVNLLLPGEKKEKATTDAEGRTTAFDGTGRYAAWTRHSEAASGELGGKKYEEVRHYATLVVDVAAAAVGYAPLPKAVSSFGAAVADGSVYQYGGHCGKTHTYSTEDVLGTFRRLNLADPSQWEDLPGGPAAQGLALVAHEGTIVRIGGMQPRNKPGADADNHSLTSVAKFDPKTGQWTDLPPLPDGRSSHDAAILAGKLYVVGGWRMNGAGKSPFWYDTALVMDLTKQPLAWESFEQPFRRRALTATAFGGRLYVVAGLAPGGSEMTVDVFDPVKKAWTKGPDLTGAKMNGFTPAACVCDGKLYVSPSDGRLLRLSDKGDAWDEVGKLQQARVVHRVVPIGGGRMLAIGGASKAGNVALTEVLAPAK